MRAIFDDYTMLPDTDGPPPLATVATGAAGIAALLPDWRDLAAWGAGGGAPASLLT